LAPLKFVPYEAKTSVVKIFSYNEKILRGTLSNPHIGGEVRFTGAIDLILKVGSLLDDLKFPLPDATPHRFAGVAPTDVPAPDTEAGDTAPIATFKLNVMFRQNASMQGGLVWVNTNTEAKFRSVYELLVLFDSVLGKEPEE
jgi:hypothetical protein